MGKKGSDRPHVVIVGGGFGGLTAAQSLARANVRITLVDRENHHLFQPLLYQVAMAGLSPADIASPIRSVLRRQRNALVLLGNVKRIDLEKKKLHLDDGALDYDYLILASGAQTSYFGHDDWAKHAPGLKTLEDAIEIRKRVLLAFEEAERLAITGLVEEDPKRTRQLTFVVIGGGPTGVELAGAIAELARYALARDFRAVHLERTRVILIEGGPRILPSFTEDLSQKAIDQLRELGVEVRTGVRVTGIDEQGVQAGDERIDAATVVWAAGVRTTPLTDTLGVPLDRVGRVIVAKDMSVPGHPEAFVIGDAAAFLHQTGKPLPGVSAVAMRQARFVARAIVEDQRGDPRGAFHFEDPGAMATIGRSRAIAELGKTHLSGFSAWMFWLFVHLWFLIGYRNRVAVLMNWAWSYFTYRRGARLITRNACEPAPVHAPAIEQTKSSTNDRHAHG